MGFSVRGHICIRRKAKDGEPGAAGKSIRTTVWEAGKQYYAGDTQVDGVYPLDIVADKAISIGVSGVNFYMCRTSHTSAANIPLTNTAYWTKLNNLKPVVTYLILAEAIKANFIDVADLAAASAFIQNLIANTTFTQTLGANSAFINTLIATSAFIDNLSVKHLNGADGTFTGGIRMPFAQLSTAGLTYMYQSTEMHDPRGQTTTYIYHYKINPTCSKYIDASEHVEDYHQATAIHIPYNANLDGYRIVLYCPRAIMGYNWGAGLRVIVPEGGRFLGEKILAVQDEEHSWPAITEIDLLRGGMIEMIIHNEDNHPVVYITAGDYGF